MNAKRYESCSVTYCYEKFLGAVKFAHKKYSRWCTAIAIQRSNDFIDKLLQLAFLGEEFVQASKGTKLGDQTGVRPIDRHRTNKLHDVPVTDFELTH